MDFYREIRIGRDGQLCYRQVTVADGLMHVRGFRDAAGQESTIVRGHATDLVSVNGRQLGGKVKGNFPAAFSHDGTKVYVQHDEGKDQETREDRTSLRIYDLAGLELECRMGAPYAAEGIAEVLEDGTVVLMNDPRRFRTMPNGEFWHNCCETDNYIVGQFGRDDLNLGGAFSVLHKLTGKVQRWLGYSPHPPFAVEFDGKLLIAISGDNTDDPWHVQLADDFPPVAPPTMPAMRFAARLRPIYRGCLSWDLDAPGNFGGDRNSPDRVIVEGTVDGWLRPENEARTLALFASRHESKDPVGDYARCKALAKAHGSAVLVYADRLLFDLVDDVAALRQDGVAALACIRCYLVGADDTAAAMLERLKVSLGLVDGPVGVTRAIYRSALCNEEQAAEANLILTDFIEDEPRIVLDAAFGWHRQQGSPVFRTWADDYFLELCARTPASARSSFPMTTTSPALPPAPAPPAADLSVEAIGDEAARIAEGTLHKLTKEGRS
jgi:hypothetical protein